MGSDFWIVLQWWGTLFLVGAVAYPLTKALFGRSMTGPGPVSWWDHGYLFSKAVGMAVVTWVVYVLGTLRVMPFSVASIAVALGVVFVLGLVLQLKTQNSKLKTTTNNSKHKEQLWIPAFAGMTKNDSGMTKNDVGVVLRKACVLVLEELFFLAALLFWSWIKAHEPSIRGLEKFMDYGFMQSILNATYFPPADMWYTPLPINYYYFGHMVTGVLTKLSGLDLAVTFNLMLATIFALTVTMSFSIGYQMSQMGQMGRMRRMAGGILTAFLVTLAGNMQTIYAFTRGYNGEHVEPFWELGWGMRDIGGIGVIRGIGDIWGRVGALWGKIGEGMHTYWYPNATRFIPYTIHEFPSYSFVVSDVHGHVLSIPFVLLAIAMLIQVFLFRGQASAAGATRGQALWYGFYGFLIGVLLMTNALDGPIYFGLLMAILVISNVKCQMSNWKAIGVAVGVVGGVAGLTSLPFLVHFKSFVTGVAVNCPPAMLANMKFGPILFEGIEKCQRSPLWMWWLLWGFFVYCGMGFVWKLIRGIRGFGEMRDVWRNKITQTEKILLVFFVFALMLVIVPEVIYFKDIYPAHFRSNTMFKLGYEAFILFSIVAGYTITSLLSSSGLTRGSSSKYTLDPRLRGDDKIGSGDDNKKVVDEKIGRFLKSLFFLFLLPQLMLVSIYPIFSVRSYFNSLKRYEGIDGLGWIRREYPTDYSAMQWLNSQNVKCQMSNVKCGRFAIVEADGDSYTDYARFSTFTGRPTVIGWAVHEWLWRGTYDAVAPRREDVRQIYESEDVRVTRTIFGKYGVEYVIVGKLEREKYKNLQEWKFLELGKEAFRSGGTVIYEMNAKAHE